MLQDSEFTAGHEKEVPGTVATEHMESTGDGKILTLVPFVVVDVCFRKGFGNSIL